jgi:hypothetical protein
VSVLDHEAAVELGCLAVVRRGVTLFTYLDAVQVVRDLAEQFEHTLFTLDGRVVSVKAGGMGSATALALKNALMKVGSGAHWNKCSRAELARLDLAALTLQSIADMLVGEDDWAKAESEAVAAIAAAGKMQDSL